MQNTSAVAALERLKKGNQIYLNSTRGIGDISPARRYETGRNGQKPYAVVVACSDSRVIPESIFSAGIGDLFTIRVAGNVAGDFQLGSVEYAAAHLGCRLVLVLGHTGCGAIAAAAEENGGFVRGITDEIRLAVGSERDAERASVLNVRRAVKRIGDAFGKMRDFLVVGALYRTESGIVDFDI